MKNKRKLLDQIHISRHKSFTRNIKSHHEYYSLINIVKKHTLHVENNTTI